MISVTAKISPISTNDHEPPRPTNDQTANRRVDVAEFAAWAKACGIDPQTAFARFLKAR
jgi:hypothetical protein